jgi:hypothetical protein
MSIYGDIVKEAETKFGAGGSKFKFKEGENKIRILAAGKPYQSTYNGQPKVNYIHWIIDRTDGKIKLAFLPYTIVKHLKALENNKRFGFKELPMPYDIIITAVGTGTKEVEYSTLPADAVPLSEAERQEFEKTKPIDQMRDKLKQKEAEKAPMSQDEGGDQNDEIEISAEDIPQ